MRIGSQHALERAKRCRPSTQRTQRLRQGHMAQRPSICADRSVLVTDSYKKTEALPPVLRQAMAFEKVLSEVPLWIQEGELIVGNIASRPRGRSLRQSLRASKWAHLVL